jgi:glutathione transport system ATP-binding protein
MLVMYAGRVVEAGTVEEIFYAPRMPYTLDLLGSQPRLDMRRQRLHPISGAPPSALDLPPGCSFAPRCPLAAPICEAEEPLLTGHSGHLSACHFSDQLVGLEPGDLFRPVSQDRSS